MPQRKSYGRPQTIFNICLPQGSLRFLKLSKIDTEGMLKPDIIDIKSYQIVETNDFS